MSVTGVDVQKNVGMADEKFRQSENDWPRRHSQKKFAALNYSERRLFSQQVVPLDWFFVPRFFVVNPRAATT
jgi:hypothetical protein